MNTIDFTPVKTAKVPAAHFAKMVGASRVSATLWLNGSNKPRGLYATRAQDVIDMIVKALGVGALPLPSTTPRPDRYKAFDEALRKAATN